MRNRHSFVAVLLGIVMTMVSLCLIASHAATVRADSGLRFVAPDGNDDNDCSSVALRCRTVQRAIDVAAPFDEIRIATGTYTDTYGTVASIVKTVQLLGGWDETFSARDRTAYPTVLDGKHRDRVMHISGTISPTVDGFIITGGNANNSTHGTGIGGGIYIRDASPVIANNVISGNVAYMGDGNLGRGGGVFVSHASAATVIRGNRVLRNIANTIAQGLGGGLYIENSAGLVTGNEIRDNVGGSGAGGVYVYECDGVTIEGNAIIGNAATITPTVEGGGGGVYIEYSTSFQLINNIIAHNSASGGGGIHLFGYRSSPSSGTLANNTVSDNAGTHGISVNNDVTITLTNNIIANHARGIGIAGATISATYTLFFNNAAGDLLGGGAIQSTNAITGTDPLFVNPAGEDYHLQPGSPAVDAGHPNGVPPAPPTDIDGDPRPMGPRVDIGADERRVYEVQARIFLPIGVRKHGP
jgi:hypothetical protein